MPRADLLDAALLQIAELERAERDANEPVHAQAEMLQHIAHFAILAFSNCKSEPAIGALVAVDRGFDLAIAHAVHRHALAQGIELRLRDTAMRAHAIAPQP